MDLFKHEEKSWNKNTLGGNHVRDYYTHVNHTLTYIITVCVYVYVCMCVCSLSTSFDSKKYFKNPTYEGNDVTPQLSPAELETSLSPEQKKFQRVAYDRVDLAPSQTRVGTGQDYDILNRGNAYYGKYHSDTNDVCFFIC